MIFGITDTNLLYFCCHWRCIPKVGYQQLDLVNGSVNANVKKIRVLSFVKSTRQQSVNLNLNTP